METQFFRDFYEIFSLIPLLFMITEQLLSSIIHFVRSSTYEYLFIVLSLPFIGLSIFYKCFANYGCRHPCLNLITKIIMGKDWA